MDVDGEPWFKYSFRNGQIGYIEMEKVGILNKFQYEDDFFGSDNRALNGTMDLISMQQQGIREGIKNGGTFRFMAQMSNFTSPEDLKKTRERFNRENLQGESGGVLIWPYEVKEPKQIDQKPYVVDADQMELIQNNVFNYFGVNEDVLQNKAVGDSWAAFYDGKLEPIAVQIGEAMTKMTFSRREIAQGNMVTVGANRLQYASTKEKLDVSAQMADRGIMNRNEIREIWGLPPIDGGDKFLVRGEYKDPERDEEAENIAGEDGEETTTIFYADDQPVAEKKSGGAQDQKRERAQLKQLKATVNQLEQEMQKEALEGIPMLRVPAEDGEGEGNAEE
jgi:hypothetical protein